ncbi:MAG: rod shape-determining protein MreC [Candidatus Nomurabacteria bacterium]
MIHQFRDKKEIAKKRRLIKNTIFLIFFLLLASLGFFASTGQILHFIGKPIWKVENFISQKAKDDKYLIRTKSSVYKDNEGLLADNRDLKSSMIDYNILKDENVSLKELLGRKPISKDLVLSNILTKPNYSPYDTIIIDIGSDVGINIGNIVYANSSTLTPIGEVSMLYANTALVTLYTNPGQTTEAMMEGTNTSVELVGRGGGNFEMSIPIDLPFVKGTNIYLPGLQTEIVAITQDVISSPNDPVKKVLLSSPVNVQSLKWVFVNRE